MRPHGTALVPVLLAMSTGAAGFDLDRGTTTAWEQYVAGAVTQLHREVVSEPVGDTIHVPGGAIHHWRGSTVVRNTTVDGVVRTLVERGIPPPQEDVVAARVLARNGESLRVYLRLRRTAIVTVDYDTEHDVRFARHSSVLATSRSVATKIAEVGESDRGFLWRLHSYWRYAQVGSNVRIELESLSLSRGVPLVVRPIAGPIIERIGRESVTRTLESLRSFLEGASRDARSSSAAGNRS